MRGAVKKETAKDETKEVKELGLYGIKKSFNKEIATSKTKFYKGSLRSGQKIEFEGSLVILGDVNAGAEVLAEDNVVVLGNLRGMAHAGCKRKQRGYNCSSLYRISTSTYCRHCKRN